MSDDELEEKYGPDFFDIHKGLVSYIHAEKVFRIYQGNGYRTTYDMETDRIISGAGMLDFLLQIHSKEWATGQHLKDLLDCIEQWTVKQFDQYPQVFFDVVCAMNRSIDLPSEL